jgi:hypothetical protein
MIRTTAPLNGLRKSALASNFAALFAATTAMHATASSVHVITTCNDALVTPQCDGIEDGTLRKAYFCAQNNDTIDLTNLQCSTVTLSAPLTTSADNLSIEGPGKDLLAINGAGKFRVFVHTGSNSGTLTISKLTATNGHYENPYTYGGGGGCIYSSTNVTLSQSTVSYCKTTAAHTSALGGGIFAKGKVKLYAGSKVSGSTALGVAPYNQSFGGGVQAYEVDLDASTITGNSAFAGPDDGQGGGISAHTVVSKFSTIAGNNATHYAGGILASTITLSNSTVSGNTGKEAAAIFSFGGETDIFNSTIAFNNATSAEFGGGVVAGNVYAQSSIFAFNTAAGGQSDLEAHYLFGADNLIVAANISVTNTATGTVTANPKLGPLQGNGGPTATHALLPGSPAINHGNNKAPHFSFPTDQRGSPRVMGNRADIGAVESDVIFVDTFDPPA